MKDYDGNEVLEHRNEIIAKAIRCLRKENNVYKHELTGLEGYVGAQEEPSDNTISFIMYETSHKLFYSFRLERGDDDYEASSMCLDDPHTLDRLRDYVCAADEEEDDYLDGLADAKERLLKEAFDDNGLVYWGSERNAEKVVYSFVRKEKGAEVQSVELDLRDMKAEMQSKYAKLKQSIKDLDEYLLHEYDRKDVYPGEAEISNTMWDIRSLAGEIDDINSDGNFIECEQPWSEVSEYFDEDWNYIGD